MIATPRRFAVSAVAAVMALALATSSARADDPASVTPPPRTTHADVAGSPPAEQATGIATREEAAPGRAMRTALRVLLFVPRWTFWIVVQPVRGGLWAFERYQLADRAQGIFFNDEGTLGAYPLAFFETGFGLNVGGRIIYRDLFGKEGRFRVRASYGGRFRQNYSVKATTGKLLGERAEIEVETGFQIFPRSRFFGLGNADLVDGDTVTMPVDPRARDVAVKTRYRHDDLSASLTGAVAVTDDVSVRFSGRYIQRDFDDDAELGDGDFQIFDIYDTARLPGYDQNLSNLGGEVELIYDTRASTKLWVPLPEANTANTGWKLSGFVGAQTGLGDDPSSFVRYGADLQRIIDIYDGTRTLSLRAYLEGVTGETDDVPFLDLPRLGGPVFLRGYQRDRFRDRIATLASAEYRWLVGKSFAGYVFVDTGRVHRRLSDIELDGLRVGYGGGLQFHSLTTFRGRFDVSTSKDGGVFLNLSFDPVYDTSSRQESL